MNNDSYDKILRKVKEELTIEQQQRLGETLSELTKNRAPNENRSIMELKGLGKEIWRSVDTDSFVERERNSWNG